MPSTKKPTPKTSVFLIGAQKAGTTTLHNMLAVHPDLYFPASPQEIHYFDLNYERGSSFYDEYFRDWSGQSLVAQTSPLYLYMPKVADRMYDYSPDSKIIAILRDPVDRAYSHYWHSVRYGFESLDFDRALARERGNAADSESSGENREQSYIARGHYASQVARYIDRFGRENVLVIGFEELVKTPLAIASRCFDFVGLQQLSEPIPVERRNSSMQVRLRGLQRLRPFLDVTFGPRFAGALDRVNLREGSYGPMSKDTTLRLRAEFQNSDAQLARLLRSDSARVMTWTKKADDD